MSSMSAPLSWKHPVVVAELPEEGAEVELAPDAASRDEIARHVGVLAVPALAAQLKVRPDRRGGASVEGRLEATVRQACVVTLEPFDNPIQETISLRFAPAESIPAPAPASIDLGEADPPDPLIDGTLDLAAVVDEFLALAVDPYPRKPGAVFSPPAEAGGGEGGSTFAALEKLKAQKGNG